MIADKIRNCESLIKAVRRHKKKGERIVFTNGCFDILHFGHVKYLEEAKKKGDILIVGVNSDSSVTRIKGKGRPVQKERFRAGVIAALECVDYVCIFNGATPLGLIKKIVPDTLVKGGDWPPDKIVGHDIVTANGGTVLSIPLIKGCSTSSIIRKIESCCEKRA